MARVIYTSTITRNVRRGEDVCSVAREVHTMSIPEGQKLYVQGIVGSTANLENMFVVEELDDGHQYLLALQDVLVKVEGLHRNLMTCKHLRFARPNRPMFTKPQWANRVKRRIFHNNITRFGRLLAALFHAGCEPFYIPGGLQYAIAYCHDENGEGGEIIVPAPYPNVKYAHDGEITAGFIVRKDEIDAILTSLSNKEDHPLNYLDRDPVCSEDNF